MDADAKTNTCYEKKKEWYKKCKFKKDKEVEMKKVEKYIREIIKANGELSTTYKHSKDSNNYGRLFAYPSIQSLSCNIRGFLFCGHTDFDFKNAHPKILEYICKLLDILCPCLTCYNNNREEILKKAGNEKEKLKIEFLKMVNSDFKRTYDDPFMKAFDKELKEIQKQVVNAERHKSIIECVPKNKNNYYGSAINHILCDYEANLLEDMMKVLKDNSLEPSVRMFDGCMVEGDHYDNPDIITKIETYINNKWKDLNIVVTTKPHETSIELPEDFEIPTAIAVSGAQYPTFEEVCIEFEKTHAKIINKSIFIYELKDRVLFMKAEQLKVSFSHLFYTKTSVNKNGDVYYSNHQFILKWLNDYSEIRRYDDVGTYPPPLVCPANIFNLWTPFSAENLTEYTEQPENLEFYLNHLKILCNNEDKAYDYFIKWNAQMVQQPAEKSTCITMISDEGAGKTTIIEVNKKMMGCQKVLMTTNPKDDCWGKFNGLMLNSYFVNLNEISIKDSHEAEGRIKGLITDDDLTVNQKGKDQIIIQSYHRWFITTNNENGASKTHSKDRRNMIIRSSDELIGNKAHFDKLYAMIDDPNFIATYYNYLKNMDISDFHIRSIPYTEYQQDLQELSVSPLELFIIYIIETNYYESEYKEYAGSIYSDYKQFCKSRGFEYIENSKAFGVRLKRLKLDGFESHRTRNGAFYTFDVAKLKTFYKMNDLMEVEETEETD